MPSKSLVNFSSPPSPVALFAQTTHSQQILTPSFSFTSALLLHSFAVRGKSSRLFPIACALFAQTGKPENATTPLFSYCCALFAKTWGVYHSRRICKLADVQGKSPAIFYPESPLRNAAKGDLLSFHTHSNAFSHNPFSFDSHTNSPGVGVPPRLLPFSGRYPEGRVRGMLFLSLSLAPSDYFPRAFTED